MSKARNKHNFKGSYILAVAVIAVACCFVVSFFNNRAEIERRQTELDDMIEQCRVQQEENDELERMLAENDIDEYVEKRARDEDLGYVMPNERIYYSLIVEQ